MKIADFKKTILHRPLALLHWVFFHPGWFCIVLKLVLGGAKMKTVRHLFGIYGPK